MIDRAVTHVLEWAAGHTDEGRYSPVGIAFHWAMAAMAIFQLYLGWRMGSLPIGGTKVAAYDLHYAIGIVMLLLILGRTGWRLLAPGPINDADRPGWQTTAAHITHYIFYTCLFGLPLTGWMMVSASARETELTLLGLTSWPLIPLQDLSNTRRWMIEAISEWMHWGLIWTLVLLIPIHIGGALKHHFIDQDDVLYAMAPVIPKPRPKPSRWRRRYRAVEKRVVSLAKRLWPRSRSRPGSRRPAA